MVAPTWSTLVRYIAVEAESDTFRAELREQHEPEYAEGDRKAKDQFLRFLKRLDGEHGVKFNLVRETEHHIDGIKEETIMVLCKNDSVYAPWLISGPHSKSQAANANYCGTCNEYLPLDAIVEHWLTFQPVPEPAPLKRLYVLRVKGGEIIKETSLCDNHFADPGRRNYSEQIGDDNGSNMIWEVTDPSDYGCAESDERARECGNR